ncbi:YggT family protein [Alicyclobacillus kakegawensis]|uniref:YggT family protein n=1 Tax=Alicyclobacillus kakegawensis TaxID=392012 RepID=UPI00082C7DE2|nr:YggT family protein [Alicyclobacillus kakegawensis]
MWTYILNLIYILLEIYGYLLIAAALMTWIPNLGDTPIGQLLTRLTEPYLGIFRRFIPPLPFGGIRLDLSFLVAIVVYFFLENMVISILWRLPLA